MGGSAAIAPSLPGMRTALARAVRGSHAQRVPITRMGFCDPQ